MGSLDELAEQAGRGRIGGVVVGYVGAADAAQEEAMTRTESDISQGFHLVMNGDIWAAVGPEFEDLVQSPTGFGRTQEEAVEALQAEMRKVGWPESTLPVLSRFTVHEE